MKEKALPRKRAVRRFDMRVPASERDAFLAAVGENGTATDVTRRLWAAFVQARKSGLRLPEQYQLAGV